LYKKDFSKKAGVAEIARPIVLLNKTASEYGLKLKITEETLQRDIQEERQTAKSIQDMHLKSFMVVMIKLLMPSLFVFHLHIQLLTIQTLILLCDVKCKK